MHCNPNCITDDGDTPLSLTDETQTVIIRELLRHGADPKNDYARYSKYLPPAQPAEPSVFVVGDFSVGKSTLTMALKIQATSGIWSRFTNRLTKISGVEQHTAGIIPHQIESEQYGCITLYDVASHSGHDSFVRNVVTGSSTAFLLVTDLRKSDEEFEESIMYWLNFINVWCSSVETKPHVIIIGSHADEVTPSQKRSKRKIVDYSLTDFPCFHFIQYVAIDCSYAESPAMTELCRYLEESCKALRKLRSEEQMSIRTYCFYFYLRNQFQDSPPVVMSKVHHAIEWETQSTIGKKSESDDLQLLDFVPHTYPDLQYSCEELNKRGHILFVENNNNIENSWIIPDTSVPLTYVTGPVSFKEYQKDLPTSTGVVPSSKMASYFPNRDPSMISQFLCRFAFCQEIADPEVLKVLHMSRSALPTSRASTPPDEKFFFFPTLVGTKAPEQVWKHGSQYAYDCGWLLQCSQSKQFLTPRFVHALLLRLAFSAMVPSFQESWPDHPAIQKRCTFWKSGLCWTHRSGVEVLVVVDNLRTVTVLLRCPKRQEIDCIQFRSAIIRKVIDAKEEFCPEVSTSEYFMLPEDATQYPLKPQSELSLLSYTEIATAIATGEPAAFDKNGKFSMIKTFVHNEPYANFGGITMQELFREDRPTYDLLVDDDFLNRIARSACDNHATEFLARILSPRDPPLSDSIQEMVRILRLWRTRTRGTYKVMRKELDNFSVFAGRNPLVRQCNMYM